MKSFGDILYIDTPYKPETGSFSKSKGIENGRHRVGTWYYCRDLFHAQLYNLNLFFFSHEPTKGHCIAAFIDRIEDMLDVHPRSLFGPTQRKSIMWIEPSRWWTVRSMRRSLYTILLRVGSKYSLNKENFESALFSDPYTIDTKYAINRFLDGYTTYTGKKKGWYNQFFQTKLDNKEIDELLINSSLD